MAAQRRFLAWERRFFVPQVLGSGREHWPRAWHRDGGGGPASGSFQNPKALGLGEIKGNIGDRHYTLPEGFDSAKHQAVSIWCKRFAVNFAAGSLAPPGARKARPRS